jgi:transcription antitermination factor NusA-like protein
MTLEQVGQIIGVTKERVRQIQNKAMEKIRLVLETSFLGTKKPEEIEAALAAEGGIIHAMTGADRFGLAAVLLN